MIICTCPKCGADLVEVVYTTIPPKCGVECHRCGWNDVQPSYDQVLRVPYPMQVSTSGIPNDDTITLLSYNRELVLQSSNCVEVVS